MLNSMFSSFRSSSSKRSSAPGEKRRRQGDKENAEGHVHVTDVLQTPPEKRVKNTNRNSEGEGPSSPVDKIRGWLNKAMSWTNNYSAWNYVVGKKKKRQEKPKTVITIDADEDEYTDLNKKNIRSNQARSVDPDVIVIDEPPLLKPAARQHEQKPVTRKEVIIIDSPPKQKPLYELLGSGPGSSSSFAQTSTPLRPPDEFVKGYKPILNMPTSQRKENANEVVRYELSSKESGPAYHRAPLASRKQQEPSILQNTTNTTKPGPSFNVGKHTPGKIRVRKEPARKPVFGRKQRSTAREVVRLEEKQRYLQLLSQYTDSSLVKSSNRTSDKSIFSSKYDTMDLSSEKLAARKPPQIPYRQVQRQSDCNLSSPRSSLLPNHSHGAPLSPVAQPTIFKVKPSMDRQHRPVDHLEETTKPKAYDFPVYKTATNMPTSTSQRVQHQDTLEDDWTKKWRSLLSEDNLKQERDNDRIKREEKRLEELKSARKQERESAIKEIQARIEHEEEESEEEEEEFVALSNDMEREIDAALAPGNPEEKLADGGKVSVTRGDLATLSNLNWLNDEVINFYFHLIAERSSTPGFPKVHSFNSFFYPKLLKTGHASLKRWTRKVDIFSFDLIVVPIHLGMHWCLAAVDFRSKTIKYYDSLQSSNQQCLDALKNYLVQESLDKKKTPYDMSGWTFSSPKDIPEQMNGCDCGVFACKYAEYLSRDVRFTFTQENMPYFRRRMVFEILKKKLL